MTQPPRACGIDFGTSNSTVGWLRPDAPILVPLEDGRATLPSAVFFNADEDSIQFGRAALAEYLEGYEGRLMRALKSLLGTSLIDGQTEVNGRALGFRELLASFIGELKARAERATGRTFDHAVFGRPVHFVDEDETADRKAQDTLEAIARQVGFREIGFQFEPIGAALHYERTLSREELVLIADIGGGTADFSIVRLSPQRARAVERREDLLGNAGIHIGGTDFDRVLSLDCVMPLLGYRSRLRNGATMPASVYFQLAAWHTINFAYTRQAWAASSPGWCSSFRARPLPRRRRGWSSASAAAWPACSRPPVSTGSASTRSISPAVRAACRSCARASRPSCRGRDASRATCTAASAPASRSRRRGAMAEAAPRHAGWRGSAGCAASARARRRCRSSP